MNQFQKMGKWSFWSQMRKGKMLGEKLHAEVSSAVLQILVAMGKAEAEGGAEEISQIGNGVCLMAIRSV